MKKALFFTIFVCCIMCFTVLGQVSVIMNGSFEQNGKEIPDVTQEDIYYWCDVNVPSQYFASYINTVWSTHGSYGADGNGLVIMSQFEDYTVGQKAYLSNLTYFEDDINTLTFDIKLNKEDDQWDSNEFSAFVIIDGNMIWNSDQLEELDVNGFYEGTVEIPSTEFAAYLNNDWYELSIGLMSNIEDFVLFEYTSSWDFIKFDKYCGGLGFLAGDTNQDCYVDLEDYSQLALKWLGSAGGEKYDLADENGIIDYNDLTVFAEEWLYNTDWTKWGDENTYDLETLPYDFDLSGEIDIGDIWKIGMYWLSDQSEPSDEFCIEADLNDDGIIDFKDFAVLANHVSEYGSWTYYRD